MYSHLFDIIVSRIDEKLNACEESRKKCWEASTEIKWVNVLNKKKTTKAIPITKCLAHSYSILFVCVQRHK